MASRGICDRVAIVGMGCTEFGEHWDKGADDLLVDAAIQAFESAGIAKDDVDAYWLGTMGSGISGLTLSRPLRIDYKPVTRSPAPRSHEDTDETVRAVGPNRDRYWAGVRKCR